ncbi:hypothetical protein BDV59DRAFT_128400 [Aspergillus ambiguus]|uniref:Zn(II)2Cys6 transcription factor n=1 Tax=Aspergillus ambiguus TaxID=176160 RepID=UPI003CCDD721
MIQTEGTMEQVSSGRRSHRKSRNGCLQCKRRKVKCDEGRPTCNKCSVHGVYCSFVDSSPPVQPGSEKSSPSNGPAPRHATVGLSQRGSEQPNQTIAPATNTSILALRSSSDLTIFDFELLHHYTTSTCYTLSRAPAVQAIWRDEAPRVGFTMPFVLHALLAISALHLARLNPSRQAECVARAQMHHEVAVHTVAPVVPFLAADNYVALFLFSSLTCIYSCSKPQGEDDFLVLFERGRISDWVRLFRGNKAIISCVENDLRTGALRALFVNGGYLAASRRGANALEQGRLYVWELRRMICDSALGPSQLSVYLETLDELSRTLAIVMKPGEQHRLDTADVFAWLLEVSDEYLDLLRQEAPIALIIFAYFCVSLRQIEWMWWMEGLSGRLMSELGSVLDEKYSGWLQWPQQQIHQSLSEAAEQ